MAGTLDLTQYKVVDFFTKKLLRLSSTQELDEWLWENTVTKSKALRDTIDGLIQALENGEDFQYHARANELEITKKKQVRRKRT